ncbi:sialate O-acetylesterase [Parapedobacter soli]|uniref:sialate O-acetylesterase n=1 Tax=Parapedobacter soli TaxID=416955 RepID=UPI0021CA64D0|nr:sialate O-acetylesterase [Parapedobacter soli]
MKKLLTIIFFISCLPLMQAQTTIPISNGDMENTAPMSKGPNDRWQITGFFVDDNTADVFQPALSGLAPGEGVGGSQAFKITTANTSGKSSYPTLLMDDINISSYGEGTYTLRFDAKSQNEPGGRPFWLTVYAYDGDNNIVKSSIEAMDDGGVQSWGMMHTSFAEQSVTIKVVKNDVVKLRFVVQHGAEDNTYWFDNFILNHEASEPPKDVKLFILSGQSNAGGAGNAFLLPQEYRQIDDEVLMFERGAWRPMGPRNRATEKFSITEATFGAELAFASEMKKRYPNHIIAIAKVAISGGTSIVAWDKDYLRADWLDDLREVNNEEKASLLLYDRLIADSRNGIELLKKRAEVKDVEVCGMLWLQTERDGRKLETVHKYEPRLKALMKNIREDLGLPELPFLIMDAHISRPNKVVQQAMLEKVAKEDGRVKIIKCDDLATYEGIHFNTEGMLGLGKRFAAAYINLEPLKPNRK